MSSIHSHSLLCSPLYYGGWKSTFLRLSCQQVLDTVRFSQYDDSCESWNVQGRKQAHACRIHWSYYVPHHPEEAAALEWGTSLLKIQWQHHLETAPCKACAVLQIVVYGPREYAINVSTLVTVSPGGKDRRRSGLFINITYYQLMICSFFMCLELLDRGISSQGRSSPTRRHDKCSTEWEVATGLLVT